MASAAARRIALTVGDPNGIGPEIVLKAMAAFGSYSQTAGRGRSAPVHVTVFGPPQALERAADVTGTQDVLRRLELQPTGEMPSSAFQFGQISAEAGVSAISSASAAIRSCQAGEFDAVVAGPHHETAIHRAGISFSGYPSLLARVCQQQEDTVFLMLVGGGLRIVHVTLHESVATALSRLTPELIERATYAGVKACQRIGLGRPRIALFGINPHASEGGLFGKEDEECVVPAVRRLSAAGFEVFGPQGADTLLSGRVHDLYVAMFHDQGHIPVKLLAPNASSALSIGADVLLASTGHGSAMDIAGSGTAKPDALLRSLRLVAGLD